MTAAATINDTTTIRELNQDELNAVQGGWIANAVGALVGGVAGGVGTYIATGGDWRATAIGAGAGALGGAINPISSVANAARAVGGAVIAGGAYRAADVATQPAAQPAR